MTNESIYLLLAATGALGVKAVDFKREERRLPIGVSTKACSRGKCNSRLVLSAPIAFWNGGNLGSSSSLSRSNSLTIPGSIDVLSKLPKRDRPWKELTKPQQELRLVEHLGRNQHKLELRHSWAGRRWRDRVSAKS